MSKKVISVAGDIQIHAWADEEKLSIKSVILSSGRGNSISLEELPDYMADEIQAGNLPGLKIVSVKKAEEVSEAADAEPKGEIKEPVIMSGSPFAQRPTAETWPDGASDEPLSLAPLEYEKRDKEPAPFNIPAADVIQSA